MFEGSCQCGEVRYRLTSESIALFVCRCTECQRQAASAFGMALWIQEYDKKMFSGVTKTWTRFMPSGEQLVGEFCQACGIRIFHQISGLSKVLSIRPGNLANTKVLRPVAHIWTDSAQPLVLMPGDSLPYPGNPPDYGQIREAWGRQQR